MVHASTGRLDADVAAACAARSRSSPASGTRCSAPTTRSHWSALGADYRLIRKHIEHVVPGFEAFEERLAQPGGFVLPNGPRDSRTFATDTGQANFTVNDADAAGRAAGPPAAADRALARPVQHHRVRARRPLPRHQGRPAGRVRQRGRPGRQSASPTASWST